MANEPITFGTEIDPAQEAEYREKVAQARTKGSLSGLKGSTPVGTMPNTPGVPTAPPARPAARPPPIQPPRPTQQGQVVPRPPGAPVLSPQTANQIQALADAQVKQATEQPAYEEQKGDGDNLQKLLEDFDFSGRSEAERILNNKKRKETIEARCTQMDFSQLLMYDKVTQLVTIIPGEFEVVFQSMTPDDDIFIKKFLSKSEFQQLNGDVVQQLYGLAQIACSVVSINGRDLPSHYNANGDPDDKAFTEKLRMIRRKSIYVVADLGINYSWFDLRVRKMIAERALGNG